MGVHIVKTFRTADGLEWKVSVNALTIKRVMDITGVKLTDIVDKPDQLTAVFSDDIKVVELLAAVVKPQLDERGMVADQFFAGCVGDTIGIAINDALLPEIIDFFREPRRGLLKRAMEKYTAARVSLEEQQIQTASQQLEALDFRGMLSGSECLNTQAPAG
jgi:hypothetical protein